MSGLFKPPAQDPVFTLGDEDIGDLDPVVILPHNTGSIKAAALQSASQRSSQSAALPVSSAAGATQGPLNGSSLAAPIVRQDVSTAKGVDATSQAHQIESVPATSSPGPTIMSNAATQIAQDHRTYSEDDLSTPASIHVTEPLRLPQSSEYKHVGSKVHNGSAQPVQGTLPNEDVATDDVRHLNEDEEQRLAKELAALEVEAEEQALQEQQRRSAAPPQRASAHTRGGDPISLSDGASSAERAMAEAEQAAQQASAGTTAMQTALDGFEPRKRPFSPPPGSAPLQRFSPTAEYIEPPDFQGLLYFDGLDSLGRPVVIVNSDAMGENRGARKSAFQYIVQVLEPIVIQGPYVLLLVSLGGGSKSNTVQTGLLVSAYRGLSRPFRKNVKYIILVRPSKPLKALLSFLRPFVSRKAHRKVLKIESLSTVAYATNNEVTLASLGPRFTAAAGDFLQ